MRKGLIYLQLIHDVSLFILLCMSIMINIISFFYCIKRDERSLGKIFILGHYCVLQFVVYLFYPSYILLFAMAIGGLLTVEDLQHMEVAFWKLAFLIVLAIVSLVLDFSLWTIVAAVLFTIGLIILHFIYGGMLGAADIIYVACITCIIGAMPTVYAICIGCILSIISVLPALTQKKEQPIPFLPGLCAGFGYTLIFLPFLPI